MADKMQLWSRNAQPGTDI